MNLSLELEGEEGHCDHQSNQPGEDEGENLYKSDEDSTADVGEEEGEDVSSQPDDDDDDDGDDDEDDDVGEKEGGGHLFST